MWSVVGWSVGGEFSQSGGWAVGLWIFWSVGWSVVCEVCRSVSRSDDWTRSGDWLVRVLVVGQWLQARLQSASQQACKPATQPEWSSYCVNVCLYCIRLLLFPNPWPFSACGESPQECHPPQNGDPAKWRVDIPRKTIFCTKRLIKQAGTAFGQCMGTGGGACSTG